MLIDPARPEEEREERLEIQYRNWVIVVMVSAALSATLGIMFQSIIGCVFFGAIFVGSMLMMCRCSIQLDECYDRLHRIRVNHYNNVKRNRRGNNPKRS